jgi:hypothetical protein
MKDSFVSKDSRVANSVEFQTEKETVKGRELLNRYLVKNDNQSIQKAVERFLKKSGSGHILKIYELRRELIDVYEVGPKT